MARLAYSASTSLDGFHDAGWEQRCPVPPDQSGWQAFAGSGIIGLGDNSAVPGSTRYWHCAWHDVDGRMVTYHLQTYRKQDGRQPMLGYGTYTRQNS